jgi:hypothetical protein
MGFGSSRRKSLYRHKKSYKDALVDPPPAVSAMDVDSDDDPVDPSPRALYEELPPLADRPKKKRRRSGRRGNGKAESDAESKAFEAYSSELEARIESLQYILELSLDELDAVRTSLTANREELEAVLSRCDSMRKRLAKSLELPKPTTQYGDLKRGGRQRTLRMKCFIGHVEKLACHLKMSGEAVLFNLMNSLWAGANGDVAEATLANVLDDKLADLLIPEAKSMDEDERRTFNDDRHRETTIMRLLKVMDLCNISHKTMHEVLTVMSFHRGNHDINDNALNNAEKALDASINELLHMDDDDDMSWIDPQRLLDFLIVTFKLPPDHDVHIVYSGDGRTYGGKTTTIVSLRIIQPTLSICFPIAIISHPEDYSTFADLTHTLRAQLRGLTLNFPGLKVDSVPSDPADPPPTASRPACGGEGGGGCSHGSILRPSVQPMPHF